MDPSPQKIFMNLSTNKVFFTIISWVYKGCVNRQNSYEDDCAKILIIYLVSNQPYILQNDPLDKNVPTEKNAEIILFGFDDVVIQTLRHLWKKCVDHKSLYWKKRIWSHFMYLGQSMNLSADLCIYQFYTLCVYAQRESCRKNGSDVLLWTLWHGHTKAGQPARTYILQLCADKGCSPEDLLEAMEIGQGWQEKVRDICVTWWWWCNGLLKIISRYSPLPSQVGL